jgi:hypothetical protein
LDVIAARHCEDINNLWSIVMLNFLHERTLGIESVRSLANNDLGITARLVVGVTAG